MAYRALAPGKRIAYIYDGGYPLFQDSGESATALRQACIGPREDRSAFHGTVSVERERQETAGPTGIPARSEEHTSELQSLMRISYAVFCLKKKTNTITERYTIQHLHY